MKNYLENQDVSRRGSAILVVLGVTVALSFLAASLLKLISQTHSTGYRYIPYSQALFTAEAGADFAWNEINKVTMINQNNGEPFADTNLWTKTVTPSNTVWTLNNYSLTPVGNITAANSSFSVTVTTTNLSEPYNGDFTVESIGNVTRSDFMGGGEAVRRIRMYMYAVPNPIASMGIGVFGKSTITVSGNSGTIASYDSRESGFVQGNPATYGFYGDIGSLITSTNMPTNAIDAGSLDIYGSIYTGPGGMVGTNSGFNMYNGDGRTNVISDNLKADMPDPSLPVNFSASAHTHTMSGGLTLWVTNGSYQNFILNGQINNDLNVRGWGIARVHVKDGIKTTGGDEITITPSISNIVKVSTSDGSILSSNFNGAQVLTSVTSTTNNALITTNFALVTNAGTTTITTNRSFTTNRVITTNTVTTGPPSGRGTFYYTNNVVSTNTSYSTNTGSAGTVTTNFLGSTSTSTNYYPLRVEFYVDGDIDMNGNSLNNTTGVPAAMQIYGLPSTNGVPRNVKFAGTATIVGVLYAPSHNMQQQGTMNFFGAAYANKITMGGNFFIAVDEALRDDESNFDTRTRYQMSRWEEF